MKILKLFGEMLFYYVICIFLTLYESIKYVFMGKNIIGKIAIVCTYAGMAVLAIFAPVAFFIILGIIAILELLFVIIYMKSPKSSDKKDQKQFRPYNMDELYKNIFFKGMSSEQAKKEYRRLMKLYHPDNGGDDVEIVQKIIKGYNYYKATCEK